MIRNTVNLTKEIHVFLSRYPQDEISDRMLIDLHEKFKSTILGAWVEPFIKLIHCQSNQRDQICA